MIEPQKLCKDCKHHRGAWLFIVPYVPGYWLNFAKCAATKDPATGGPEWYCGTQRSSKSDDMCGREGKFFESKESAK